MISVLPQCLANSIVKLRPPVRPRWIKMNWCLWEIIIESFKKFGETCAKMMTKSIIQINCNRYAKHSNKYFNGLKACRQFTATICRTYFLSPESGSTTSEVVLSHNGHLAFINTPPLNAETISIKTSSRHFRPTDQFATRSVRLRTTGSSGHGKSARKQRDSVYSGRLQTITPS